MMITTFCVRQAVHSAVFGQVPIVTGLTEDLVLVDGTLVTVPDAIATEMRRIYDNLLVAIFDINTGLRAHDPQLDAELRRLYTELHESWPTGVEDPPSALTTGQPLAALALPESFAAISALLRQTQTPVGVVIARAELAAPDPMGSDVARLVVGSLLGAFAQRGTPRSTRMPNPIVLVAGQGGNLASPIALHPLAQNIVVVPPVLEERVHVARSLGLDDEYGQLASNLSRRRLLTLAPIREALGGDPNAARVVRVAVNGMPRRPWSAKDRARLRDHVAPDVRASLPGQEAVVDRVCDALAVAGTPRIRAAGPRDVFLLAGPPAVGKTELARRLGHALFGDAGAIRRFDMTEFMEAHSRAKLIGAPPGYVGYEGGGQLTDWVRSNPDSIVLLDEIEKAHPDVMLLLLQILEDGRLTDGRGLTVDFGGTVVLMTTNLGSADAVAELTASGVDPDPTEFAARILELVREALQTPISRGGLGRPELWSRLQGAVVTFDVVRRANLPRIVRRLLVDFETECADAGHPVTFDHDGVARLVAQDPRLAGLEGTWDTRTVLTVLRDKAEIRLRWEIATGDDGASYHVGVTTDADSAQLRLTIENSLESSL